MQHVVQVGTDPSRSAGTRAGVTGPDKAPADLAWDPPSPPEPEPTRARRWAGRLTRSLLLTAPVLVGAGALATVSVGATDDVGADGTLVATAGPARLAGPRITAYPGDARRFYLTVEDARACALPAGVTGPTADGRVRLTVTVPPAGPGTPAAAPVRVADDALKDARIYYASPDDIVIGFSRVGPAGLDRARALSTDIECRAPDGSWTPVGSTGAVAVPARADGPPVAVPDPLTADSQVTLAVRTGGNDRMPEATVDGRSARIAEVGEGGDRPRALLPSGTGPGLHLLTLRFDGDRAASEADLTVPIVNGYAAPSAGAGAVSEAAGSHGSGHRPVSLPVTTADQADDGYGAGSVVLGGVSLLLLGTAGGLIWIFHRRGMTT